MLKYIEKDVCINHEGTLISFVNHHFGPLRGLNFILRGCSEKEIREYLTSQPVDTIDKIWSKTLISSRAMALPMKFMSITESSPIVVSSIKKGEMEVIKNLERGILTGDPFFFRSFIY